MIYENHDADRKGSLSVSYQIDPLVTGSLIELGYVKNYLGIGYDGDDTLLQDQIHTAFDMLEMEFKVIGLNSEVTMVVENPGDVIYLRHKPIQIDSIEVVDVDDEPIEFNVVGTKYKAHINLETTADVVTITYTAGFGEDPLQFNEPLFRIMKQAALQMVGTFYEDRENNVIGVMNEIPSSSKRLMRRALKFNGVK